ncbi:B3/B4 domain-containing protein [Nocardia amamiensis]|uniref:B3/B4 domain-containing protein n=1 Tax=Nocardia amamiensis TaxID=404578 RepID=UPI0014708C54|nr:phenylalanine--tRNA ligase beta subunit-related protein [Nocardia amamiensis]
MSGLQVPGSHSEALSAEIESVEQALLHASSIDTLKHEPYLKSFRDVHSSLGGAAKGELAAPEVLLRALHRRGRLPRINALVDIYNLVSAETRLAFGAHDLAELSGNLRLAMTTGAERFVPLGAEEPVEVSAGEYAYLDDEDVLCRLEVRQCEKSKVDASTTDCLFVVHGSPMHSHAQLMQAEERLVELLSKYCGGRDPVDVRRI